MAEPDQQRVVRRDASGRLLYVWEGLQRPYTLAVDTRGRLLVSDPSIDEVAIFPPMANPPQPPHVVVRDDVQPGQIGFTTK